MSFEDILAKKASEVKQMPPTPTGTYIGIVAGPPKKSAIGKDQTDVYDYDVKLLQPQDDVNLEELEAAGGMSDRTIRARFFLTEKASYRLKDFCLACGVEEADKSLGQMAAEAVGRQVKVQVTHSPSQDGQSMYANATAYSAV